MAWCRHAPSHYLNQCWLRSILPYGITKCGLAGVDPLDRDAWRTGVRHILVLPLPHRMGHEQHINLRWIWMDGWRPQCVKRNISLNWPQFLIFSGHYDKCLAQLRDAHKDNMGDVVHCIFSHCQVAKKNQLIITLIVSNIFLIHFICCDIFLRLRSCTSWLLLPVASKHLTYPP